MASFNSCAECYFANMTPTRITRSEVWENNQLYYQYVCNNGHLWYEGPYIHTHTTYEEGVPNQHYQSVKLHGAIMGVDKSNG